MSFTTSVDISFDQMTCGNCGIMFYVPLDWKNKKVQSHGSFHCPNGCERVFVAETEAERLKKIIAQKERELANKTSEKIQLEGQLEKTQKQLKRVHRGTCPCCKRTFQNLKRHMESKHPEKLKP